MERVIGALALLVVLFVILSFSRNNGSGFFAGLVGGAVGGGILYKLLSGGSSGCSASDANIEAAETATQQSDSTVRDMRERASEVSSGQRPRSDAPEPSELYEAIVNMEEPINAFKLMAESSGKDLQSILQKSKEFLELRNDEKEKLDNIKEALGPGKGVVYELRQLAGQEDVVAGTEDNIANSIINNIESIESEVEGIESDQSQYEDLLTQEEHQLVADMKQNLRSLKDIEACIDAISQAPKFEEAISRMMDKAQTHHNLQLTNQEIQKIESTIEHILEMEENIVEELEELRQIEQQTEEITQQELNEIKTIIQGANSVEELAQQAFERSKLTENQKNKILEVTETLKEALNGLGADLETEEKEEEQLEDEFSEAEREVSEQVDREEREISEAEDRNEEESQRENTRSNAYRDGKNKDILNRIEQRISQIEGNSGRNNGLSVALKAAYELRDNFEVYEDDFYHGTWGQSLDSFVKRGVGNPSEPQMTGETGTNDLTSFTYLPAVAFHYSVRGTPNSVSLIEDYLKRNYGFEPASKNKIRKEIIRYVEKIRKNMDSIQKSREIVEYDLNKLSGIIESSNNLAELKYRYNQPVDVLEAIVAVDINDAEYKGQTPNIPTRNEIKSHKKGDALGEIKIRRVPPKSLSVYVPTGFVESYREKYSHSGVKFKNLDSLLMKHEIKMRSTYEAEGMINYSKFWEGHRLGIGVTFENYTYRANKIQISH